MPRAVCRFGICLIIVMASIAGVMAQAPTSGDVTRDRISKAKAFFAIKNYTAAIYELEGIKRETNDPTVQNVANVMLMSCFLEQSDYKRAQALLNDLFNAQKANRPNAQYFAVAAQVVKGSKIQVERYKMLGLSVSDRNLPTEAAAEVNKMRETVELVIEQSKTLSQNKKLSGDAMAMLEESSGARSSLARDDYDARRWKNEVADAREQIVSSRSVVLNAADDAPATGALSDKAIASTTPVIPKPSESAPIIPASNPQKTVAAPVIKDDTIAKQEPPKVVTPMENITKPVVIEKKVSTETVATAPEVKQPEIKQPEPVKETPKEITRERVAEKASVPAEIQVAGNTALKEQPKVDDTQIAFNKVSGPSSENTASTEQDASPLQVGSLIDYATQKIAPAYPPAAKTMRMTGTVKVEVMVDESGQVAVQNASGPSVLRRAAEDAVKRWKFKPFMRDGQPVKASGYVNFNFNL